MASFLKRIADAPSFTRFITIVILLAGVLVGAETYQSVVDTHGPLLHTLDAIVLGIFVVEILIKMGAHGPRPWLYFKDPWNVFDFVIVAACFMPFGSRYVTVLRLARLLRVLRLVKALPKLQLLVGALLKSIPSMGYVSVLLFLLFYVYAVAGVFIFGQNDPVHFGDLENAMLTLFRIVTLEDWTDIMYTQIYGCAVYPIGRLEELCTAPKGAPAVAVIYFVSFVLMGTMIVLNLFIGVIMNGMTEAQVEAERERAEQANGQVPLADELAKLHRQLAELQGHLGRMVSRAAEADGIKHVVPPPPASSRSGFGPQPPDLGF